MIKTLCDFISRYMAVLVVAVAALALLLPSSFNWIGTSWISPLLGLVMFGMGLTLNPSDFRVVFSRPKDVIIGSIAQFTIMPLTAFLLAKAFNLSDEMALGVILVGCCPGGTASNVITYLAKGDLALSVGMTAVSTVLAPVVTPLLTWALAGERISVDMAGMFLSILYVVIVPIIAGFVINRYFPRFTKEATNYLPAFSSLMIAVIVGTIVSANAAKLWIGGAMIILIVALHNIFGLLLGYWAARIMGLERKKRIAISIEVGMQNSGLASSLAALHFAMYPMATIPGAVFSVWHNLSGAIMARIYSSKTSSSDSSSGY